MASIDTSAAFGVRAASAGVLDERVLEALHMRDPLGVVSLYVADRPASISELMAHRHAETPAVRRALAELGRRVLRHPAHGHAVFFALTTGQVVDVALPLPVRASLALDELARVRPLLEALDRGRPAGFVELTSSRMTASEVRGHHVRTLDAVAVGASHGRRDRRGPRRAAPRLRAGAAGFAGAVGVLAGVRGWDVVVVAGPRAQADDFRRRFPAWRTTVVALSATPHGRERVARIADAVAAQRAGRAARLAADARRDPATVWGVEGALDALRDRRAAHVLLAGDLDPVHAERIIREAVAHRARLTLARPGALGISGVAATARA